MAPSIIHLSCHGNCGDIFNKELESTSAGETNIRDLNDFINPNKTRLVVINSCQSSKILEVFKESNIPFVITYNKKRENDI